MAAIPNFRDLAGIRVAGLRIRPGMVYRSGILSYATESDRQIVAGLNIAHVIDLRTVNELDVHGTAELAACTRYETGGERAVLSRRDPREPRRAEAEQNATFADAVLTGPEDRSKTTRRRVIVLNFSA